jgi:hypothetical protein
MEEKKATVARGENLGVRTVEPTDPGQGQEAEPESQMAPLAMAKVIPEARTARHKGWQRNRKCPGRSPAREKPWPRP